MNVCRALNHAFNLNLSRAPRQRSAINLLGCVGKHTDLKPLGPLPHLSSPFWQASLPLLSCPFCLQFCLAVLIIKMVMINDFFLHSACSHLLLGFFSMRSRWCRIIASRQIFFSFLRSPNTEIPYISRADWLPLMLPAFARLRRGSRGLLSHAARIRVGNTWLLAVWVYSGAVWFCCGGFFCSSPSVIGSL